MNDWKPTATIDALKSRSAIVSQIRQFFATRGVWEADTPALSQATVTDIHLHTFATEFKGPGFANGQTLYCMTSPEFHMKRLLAAGSGSIFQINKAFRNEESGRYHNPEFTMLEWYRVDFDHHQLMDEMSQLLQQVLDVKQCDKITYQQAFIEHIGCCPLEATVPELQQKLVELEMYGLAKEEQDRDTLLQLLFALKVEPEIGQLVPCMVYDFPASQAALAKISACDPRVADRFEVYYRGVELANGFHELQDAREQRRRFEQDNHKRVQMGLEPQPIDHHLLAALEQGLPHCAGVALGIDRLIMLATNAKHIDEVLAFPVTRA